MSNLLFLLMILLHATSSTSGDVINFRFIEEPRDLDYLRGATVKLGCRVGILDGTKLTPVNVDPRHVTWFLNDVELTSSMAGYERDVTALTILTASIEHMSVVQRYRCHVTISSVVLVSREARVGEYYVRPDTSSPSHIHSRLGDDVWLPCRYSASRSSTRLNVTWYRDDVIIGSTSSPSGMTSQGSYVLSNGTLLLRSAKAEWSGSYRFVISGRTIDKKGAPMRLTVLATSSQPAATSSSSGGKVEVTAVVGDRVFLPCPTSSRANQDGVVEISHVTLRDQDTLHCARYRLVVSSPPRPDDPQTHPDDPQVLRCPLRGFPEPEVKWWRDGQVIDGQVKREGLYQCEACNELGCEQSIVTYDDVNSLLSSPAPPSDVTLHQFSRSYVIIKWRPADDDGDVTTYLVRVASTDGDVTSEEYYVREEAELRYEGEGEFEFSVRTCTRRLARCSSQPATLRASTATDAQMNDAQVTSEVRAVFSSDGIEVSWSSSGESLGDYKVVLWSDDEQQVCDVSHVTAHKFRHVTPNTWYKVKVALLTADHMVAPFSAPVHVFTGSPRHPAEIMTSPEKVRVSGNTSSLTVEWEAIDVTNLSLLGYKVQVRDRHSKDKWNYPVPANTTSLTVVLGRDVDDLYVRVAGLNKAGQGPWSSKAVHSSRSPLLNLLRGDKFVDSLQQPPGQPEQVKYVASPETILLKWKPPRDDVVVTWWEVRWGEHSPDEYSAKLHAKSSTFTVPALTPNTVYRISVQAVNEAGIGPSKIVEARTLKRKYPDVELYPPLGVAISVLSPTALNVTWADKEVRRSGYFYKIRCKTSAPVENRVQFLNTTQRFIKIEQLRPFTYYEITVCVVQGRLVSDWSMIASDRTQETLPGSAPSDLTVMPMPGDPSTAKVNWQPPDQPNGQLNGYLIFYSVDYNSDVGTWVTNPVVGNALSAKIHQLTPNTHYYFMAQARNSKGVGPLSSVVQYRTPKTEDGDGDGGDDVDDDVSVSEVEDVSDDVEGDESVMTRSYYIYLVIGVVALLFIVVVAVATAVVCCGDRMPFRLGKKSELKRRVKYTQPSHVIRAGGLMDSAAIYRTGGNMRSTTVMSKNPPQQQQQQQSNQLSNGVASNSWSRSTLYRSKPALYDDRRLDSYVDMIPEPLGFPPHQREDYSSQQQQQDYGPSYSSGGMTSSSTTRYPYEGALSDCAVDSAYGSDHPFNPSQQQHVTPGSSNHKRFRSTASHHHHQHQRKMTSAHQGGSHQVMGSEAMSADLADVVEFVEDMKSSAEI